MRVCYRRQDIARRISCFSFFLVSIPTVAVTTEGCDGLSDIILLFLVGGIVCFVRAQYSSDTTPFVCHLCRVWFVFPR